MSNQQQSGFDIDLGNTCSKNAYSWAKKTFANRAGKAGAPVLKVDGAFSNLLDFNGQKIGISSDGIGTKIELAERTNIYNTIGFDLMAMVVDDLIAGGFVPTNISNILDVDLLHYDTIDQLMNGLHDAANFCNVAVTGGEIAELGKRIGGYGEGMHFNWCSTAIGILHPKLSQPIDGSQVQAGDKVISLRSHGFRSNGFSAVRRIMEAAHGADWHKEAYDDQTTWGEKLLQPSLIFSPMVTQLLDADITVKGVAHITGGGIKDNFQRVLKVNGLGADLDQLFPPHEVMTKLQKLGNLSEEQAYLYWNMGNGMLLVVPEAEADKTMQVIAQTDYEAVVAGSITTASDIQINL